MKDSENVYNGSNQNSLRNSGSIASPCLFNITSLDIQQTYEITLKMGHRAINCSGIGGASKTFLKCGPCIH